MTGAKRAPEGEARGAVEEYRNAARRNKWRGWRVGAFISNEGVSDA